jgi:hypothetical protein
MTDHEIALALEALIREDAKRPSEEQIRDLIDAGVIDEHGRVLIGGWDQAKHEQRPTDQKPSNDAPAVTEPAEVRETGTGRSAATG